MKHTIKLSEAAFADIESIVEYYLRLNRKTAFRYYKEILKRIRNLSMFPRIGRIVPEFEEELFDKYREIIFKQFRIIYRIDHARILIIRIIDARRMLDLDLIAEV